MLASSIRVKVTRYLSAPGDAVFSVVPLLSNKSLSSAVVYISSVTTKPIVASGVEVNLETTSD